MNCNDIDDLLARGEPLDTGAAEHVASCPKCGPLTNLWKTSAEGLSAEEIEKLRHVATGRLRPVRALPRDRTLVSLIFGLFAVFCISAGAVVTMGAVRRAPAMKLSIFLCVIAACVVLAALVTVQEIIPGAKRRLQPGIAVVLIVAALLAMPLLLFPNFTTANFFRWGIGCLRVGSLCALAAGALLLTFTAKYSSGSVLRMALTVGCLSGLAGVAVLTLHCSAWNVPHVIVWHFGVLAVGIAIGASFGLLVRKVKDRFWMRLRNF